MLSRGTSPRVSNGDTSPADEAKAPVSAQQSLLAATLGSARALRVDEQVGALREGLQADIAIVNLAESPHQPVRDPHDALVFSASGRDVLLTIVAGKEIYRNQRVLSVDEKDLQSRLEHLSRKLDRD